MLFFFLVSHVSAMVWVNPFGVDDFAGRVFDISGESVGRGDWFWWFWLFFMDNPDNPERPKQLMILWTKKNVRSLECNGRRFEFEPWVGGVGDGAVAGWYFDGETMHHNMPLEKCQIRLDKDRITCEPDLASFYADSRECRVRAEGRFDFTLRGRQSHGFTRPAYSKDDFFGRMGYSLLAYNRFDLRGVVEGKHIRGSAFFQRVFVNAPIVPWYWGIFHFGNGGALTYYRPSIFGKSLRQEICFFDGVDMHVFDRMDVKRVEGGLPRFIVSGRNGSKELAFEVVPYAHSSWTLRSSPLHLFRTKLVYNEYPATIGSLSLTCAGKSILSQDALGGSVGNAEHTTGILI